MTTPVAPFRLALAAVNLIPGGLDENLAAITEAYEAARDASCDLVVFPELAICGYPPEDLVARSDFLAACSDSLNRFASLATGPAAFVGFPTPVAPRHLTDATPRRVANAAAWVEAGEITGVYRKQLLPNYSVFDEVRLFSPGNGHGCTHTLASGVKVAGLICEDLWRRGPTDRAIEADAQLVVVANASPYTLTKPRARRSLVAATAARTGVPVAYANLVGGVDEIVFDGRALAADATGRVQLVGQPFAAELCVLDGDLESGLLHPADSVPLSRSPVPPSLRPPAPITVTTTASLDDLDVADVAHDDEMAELYAALVAGIRDYVAKNGFERVWIGISGGVDSALVATLATDALGPDAVCGIAMPGPFSSPGSLTDARELAARLAISLEEVSITPMVEASEAALAPLLAGLARDTTEENLQARLRGLVLMAASNKHGGLVLSTGNKSETSVGFCTLYGDVNGGIAPLKDASKSQVFALCAWRNRQLVAPLEPIPTSILTKPPSAELAPDQLDESSLGSYDDLDAVLAAYVEHDVSPAEIVASTGLPADYVRRICSLVDRNEYKRRQAPPGVKVTDKAFGRDRRLPITNGFRAPVDQPPADRAAPVAVP